MRAQAEVRAALQDEQLGARDGARGMVSVVGGDIAIGRSMDDQAWRSDRLELQRVDDPELSDVVVEPRLAHSPVAHRRINVEYEPPFLVVDEDLANTRPELILGQR